MKKYILLAVETTLVLLLFYPQSTTAIEPVLDINYHPVLAKTPYYVIPLDLSQGGGITLLSRSSDSPCPYNVALGPMGKAIPLKFLFFGEGYENMLTDIDINIVFDYSGQWCPEPKGWRLVRGGRTSYVKTGGEIGKNYDSDWFKIKKVGAGDSNVYKFVWGPDFVAPGGDFLDLGVVSDEDGFSYLASNSEPLLVKFMQTSDQ